MSAHHHPNASASQRGLRMARFGLILLVCVAVLAPLLAGDRPLLVRASLPSALAAEARLLVGACVYDVRRGAAGADEQVARVLARVPGHAAPAARAALIRLGAAWEGLVRSDAGAKARLEFLAHAGRTVARAEPARRTLAPALAAAGRGTAALVLAGGIGLLVLVLRRRNRLCAARRGMRVAAAVAAGIVLATVLVIVVPAWTGLGAAPPGFPASRRALLAEDPSALAIWPPVRFAPDRPVVAERLAPPLTRAADGGRHWLGTDDLGRDLAALVIWGARTSLAVGFASVAILLAFGIALGAAAGYCRGAVDRIVTRLIEIFQAFPALVLILAAVSFLEGGLWVVILVIGCTRWAGAARLVRGEFLRLREADFVVAARMIGCSTPRVIVRHMLPNALGPVLVHAAFAVAAAVLVESSLAFLGLGDRGMVSWGQVIDRGRQFVGAWWVTVFPGVGLFLTVLVLRTLGEGLRTAAGPRTAS